MHSDQTAHLEDRVLQHAAQTALEGSDAIATHLYLLDDCVLHGRAVAYEWQYARKIHTARYVLDILGIADATYIHIPVGKGSALDAVVEHKEASTTRNMFDLVFPALKKPWQKRMGRLLLKGGTRYLGLNEIVSLPLLTEENVIGIMAYGNPQLSKLEQTNDEVTQHLLSLT